MALPHSANVGSRKQLLMNQTSSEIQDNNRFDVQRHSRYILFSGTQIIMATPTSPQQPVLALVFRTGMGSVELTLYSSRNKLITKTLWWVKASRRNAESWYEALCISNRSTLSSIDMQCAFCCFLPPSQYSASSTLFILLYVVVFRSLILFSIQKILQYCTTQQYPKLF